MAAGFPFPSMVTSAARGFYVIRRVRAETPQDAERQAIAALQTEERYRFISESTQ